MVKMRNEVPGPNASKLLEERKKYVPRGISYSYPLFVKDAKGAMLTDVDDNQFIDFAGGIGVANAGHCPEQVVSAVKEQLDRYIHTNMNTAMYEPYVRLAHELSDLVPGDFPKKTMFGNSGAEAVENAVKIARRYTNRQGIIGLECAFHGRTLMTMSLTSKYKPYKNGFGPFAPEVYRVPSAYCYRCYFGLSYPNCEMQCVKNLARFFVAETPAENIAALIVEPVQGEGGFLVPPPEYLPGLKEICSKHGIMFIADEIQSGFGRTGKMFAIEHFNVVPDLMTIAKSLGAGFPISAVTGRAEVMEACDPGEIGGTYGGNPISCVAGLQVIDLMKKNDLPGRAAKIGNVIYSRMKELQEKYPIIGDVRGLGAMIGIELVKDLKTKEPAKEQTSRLAQACFKRGLVILTAGIYSNVIRVLCPLVITDDQLNEAMAILEDSLEEVSRA